MNTILNSIKLDYYILKSSDFRRIAIVVVVAILVAFLSKNPPLILAITMMISGFFMSTIFAVVEKNSLNKLYGILPVEKHQTVIGRYLFALIAGITIVIVATILTFAAAFILKVDLDSLAFTTWLCGSFFLFCLLVSVQFPLYFKYDFSKLAAFANLPYVIIVIAGSFAIKKYPQIFAQIVPFFIRNPYMIWVLALAGALLVLCISTIISIALYKKREL
jgi:hypothetical protein